MRPLVWMLLLLPARALARDCDYYGGYGPGVYNLSQGFDDNFASHADYGHIAALRVGFRIDTQQTWDDALFAQYDAIVAKANQHDTDLLGLVLYESTRLGQSSWNAPPGSNGENAYVQTFVSIMRTLMMRYGDSIKNWEIWNEPNTCFTDHLSDCTPNPQTAGGYYIRPEIFAALLVETYLQNEDLIRSKGLHLVTGGLYAHVVGGAPYAAGDYAELVYSQPILARFAQMTGRRFPWDGFGFHIYTDLTGATSPQGIRSYLDQINAVRARHSDSSPLWITEFGWWTPQVSEAQQAANLDVALGVFEGANVARTFVFRVSEWQGWGIFRADWTRKPAVDVYWRHTQNCTRRIPPPDAAVPDAEVTPPPDAATAPDAPAPPPNGAQPPGALDAGCACSLARGESGGYLLLLVLLAAKRKRPPRH